MQRLVRHSMSPVEALHQVVFVLELEEGRDSDSEVFLLRTGLIGQPNRSDWWVSLLRVLSLRPV